MSKLVTLEASQGVRNRWHNRYIQASSFDRLRKWRHVKSKDQSVRWNKFVIPTNLYPPWEKIVSQISSSDTPSKSLDFINPFDVLRETYGEPELARYTESLTWAFSVAHSTKRELFLSFLPLSGSSAKPLNPFQTETVCAKIHHQKIQWQETLAMFVRIRRSTF